MGWVMWENLTPDDYMDITFMDKVNQNILHIRSLIIDYIHAVPEYFSIDTSEGYQTQPFPDYLNQVERNLDSLQKEITWEVLRGAGRIWLGEQNDNPTFRHSDVNRWFSDLLIMKFALEYIPHGWRVSGTFACGNNYLLQRLRR